MEHSNPYLHGYNDYFNKSGGYVNPYPEFTKGYGLYEAGWSDAHEQDVEYGYTEY